MTPRVKELLTNKMDERDSSSQRGDEYAGRHPVQDKYNLDRVRSGKEVLTAGIQKGNQLARRGICAKTANHQPQAFIAPCQMAEAIGINCLVARGVLAKLESFEGEAVLAIPDWSLRPWYAKLRELSPKFSPLVEPILTQRIGDRLFSTQHGRTENFAA